VVPVDFKIIRRQLATVLIVAALALAITGLALLTEITSNSENFGYLYPFILLINGAGAAVLLLLIGANLWRLFRDHRRNVPGARLKSRLVSIFVVLVLVPLVVVYLFAVQFLNEGIDSWFDVEIEQGLADALDLSRGALDLRMRDNLDRTRSLADSLYSVPDEDMYEYLPRLRIDAGARELTVLAGGHRIIATSSSNPTDQLPLLPSEEMLLSLRRNNYFVALEPRPDDQYLVRTAVLLPGRSGREIRILQGLYPLGKRLGPLAGSVQKSVTRYAELSFLREPLKGGFILTLSIVVLIAFLIAVYGAFFFARRLTAPVQNLVAGTRAVAQGDLDTRLPTSERDEIGFLVDSFNDMIDQLSTARAEARRSEAQVENERAGIEAILAGLSTGVIALEKNLTIRTANAAAEALLNQTFRGREGESIASLAQENQGLKKIVDIVEGHLQLEESEWREQVKLQLEGGSRVVVCACTSLPGSFRSRGGFVLVFDDITELLQAQREAAWGEVARRLAHEIKNPLTPIQLSAERIRKKLLDVIDPASAELLDRATQTIVQQVEAMRDMVNAFSEYARAPTMNRTLLNINHLIIQVADLYPAQHNQPVVRLDLEESLPDISVDGARMRQVLHNLIRNALEALESQDNAEVVLSTKFVAKKKRQYIQIVVRDNGPGLPADSREKIFEPYVTTKAKGTGLGLAIVKKLVEEHGGEISIESEVNEGTSVKLLLPVEELVEVNSSVTREGSTRRQSA
jgi:nitrogen fixation/metabolism regulation signal transduction histidine kinase